MKKLIIFTLFSFCAFVLFGCTPPADLTTNLREERFETDATEITMWVNDFEDWNNELNFSQRIDFNDNVSDGIQLKQVLIDVDSFDDLIRSSRETNKVPDIYMVSYGNLYKEVKNGYAADLSTLFSDAEWEDLFDSAMSGVTFEDKQYAYPILLEPSTMLFYRKDLLLRYGGVTEIPTNWADFVTLCATITAAIKTEETRGLYAFDVPKGVALGWGSWGFQIAATDGLAITDDWTTSRLTNAGYTQLGQLWQTLYTNRYVPLSSGNYTEIINDLCLSKLVMTTAGSWSIATIVKEYPDMVSQIGVAAMPTFDGTYTGATATNGGWVYVISSTCENKEQAAQVIEYLVAGESGKSLEYFQGANYSKSSPRQSIQALIVSESQTQSIVPVEWISVLSDVASKAPMEPIYSWDISIAVSSLLENCALGNDLATEIQTAHQSVINLISTNDLANKNPRE
jgi:multiple sugar transport system substrate-binding protein